MTPATGNIEFRELQDSLSREWFDCGYQALSDLQRTTIDSHIAQRQVQRVPPPGQKSNIGILDALRQAKAFIAEELDCRRRSMLPLTDPTCAGYIKSAEDALTAVRDAIGECRG
jgi:hypothetical protein